MKSACSNCDLLLKRADCTERDHIRCECRRWMIEVINLDSLYGFMHVLNEALESVFENQEDLKMNKIRIINLLSESIID